MFFPVALSILKEDQNLFALLLWIHIAALDLADSPIDLRLCALDALYQAVAAQQIRIVFGELSRVVDFAFPDQLPMSGVRLLQDLGLVIDGTDVLR